MFNSQKENPNTAETPPEQIHSLPVKNEPEVKSGEATSCPPVISETSSNNDLATPEVPRFATLPATPISHETLQSSVPVKVSTFQSVSEVVAVDSTTPSAGQAQDTIATMLSEPKIPTSEISMKKELQDLLRDMYIKYPGAQDDDQVEKMALLLKVSLLDGEEERVRELKREIKVYLIAHHG
jgi:hypothetical protein